jgi:hypothetical protein
MGQKLFSKTNLDAIELKNHISSYVRTNFDSNNLQVKFKVFLPNPAELDKSL